MVLNEHFKYRTFWIFVENDKKLQNFFNTLISKASRSRKEYLLFFCGVLKKPVQSQIEIFHQPIKFDVNILFMKILELTKVESHYNQLSDFRSEAHFVSTG